VLKRVLERALPAREEREYDPCCDEALPDAHLRINIAPASNVTHETQARFAALSLLAR
jgi:hypothetical protein